MLNRSKETMTSIQRLLHIQFTYSKGTGYLHFKYDGRNHKSGDRAGYYVVSKGVKRSIMLTFRCRRRAMGVWVWAYHKGYLPLYVGYRDGNPLNTKIENLYPSDKQPKRNPNRVETGIRSRPSGSYTVEIYYKGKMKYLGSAATLKEARALREEGEKRRDNGDFDE